MNGLLMLIYSKLVMKNNLKTCEHNSFIIFNVLSSLFLINVMYTCFSRGDAEH